MPRRLIPLLLAGAAWGQGILPETWREHSRIKAEPLAIEDSALWAEFGGETAEQADYRGPAGRFQATAWRLKDSTGALAWYQAMRPANAVPLRGIALASTTPGSYWIANQNYVLRFEGWRPTPAEFKALWPLLPQLRSGGGLPVLAGYLPEKGRIRNSERYLLGVSSLAKFAPQIPGTLPGFELGVEAQAGRFQSPAGTLDLIVFSYPTPQMAREKLAEFEKQPDWVVRRSGAYLAVIPSAAGRTAAESLASSITYGQNLMWNEAVNVPTVQDAAKMILVIFELTGVLLLFCLGGGILFAAFWLYMRRRLQRRYGNYGNRTVLDLTER